MITRARWISNARCTRRNKETLHCNTVRYLSSSSAMYGKVARVRKRDISDKKQVKKIADKKGFCCEGKKRKMQKKVHLESYSNVKRGNQKNRVLLAVYDRITRAKSKKILGTQMRCSNEGVASPCMKEREIVGKGTNAMDGKRSMRPSTGPTAQVKENICQSQFEFGQNKQERMIEVRMTRAKKNRLLQIQADEENAASECLCEHTSTERCAIKVDSDNKSFSMYNCMLQRKRKRMPANMFSKGLEEDSCIPETGLQSEPSLKIRGNDVPEQECRCPAITSSAMQKENAHTMIKDQTICGDVQSNNDLQNQSREVEVTDMEQIGFTDFAQLRKKLNSSKGRESVENGSNANACLEKQIESRMQSNRNCAGFRDSQYWTRNLRHRKCSVDTNIINSVQVFHDSLNPELRESAMEGSTGAKVLSTTVMPTRVTRSMSKTSCCVEKLEQKWVGMRCVVPHKIEQKEEDCTVSVRNLCSMKKNVSSSTGEYMKEKVGRGRPHIEDEDQMGLNSTEEANLNNFGSSDDKYRSASEQKEEDCTVSVRNLRSMKKKLSSSTGEYMKEKVGRGRPHIEDEDRMGLKSTEEANLNNFGSSDNKYRSASGCNNISAFSNEGGGEDACQDSKLCGSKKVIEDGEGKGHTHTILRRKKKQNSDTRKEYMTRSKQENIEIEGDLARCAASEIALINEGRFENHHQESKICGSNKALEDSEGKGHLFGISKQKKKQNCGIQKEYWTRSKHEDMNIQGDMARQAVLEIGTELEMGSKGCFDVRSETLRPEDGFEYSCWESKPSGSSKAAEDSEIKGHLCRNSKQKKKQNFIAPEKGYWTRSKLEDRNAQGDMARCSVSEMDVSSLLCDKGGMNHRVETATNATMESMVCSPPASKDESNVLLEINSVGLPMGSFQQKSFGKSTGEFQAVNMDGGSCLSLDLEQLEADSIGQDTSVPERTKNSLLRSQTSMLSHGQCDDFTHENQRSLVERAERKGFQGQNLCLGSFDGQSAFLQHTNNSKVTNIKAEVTLDPNYDCSKRKPRHSETSDDCHEDHWSDLKRKRIETAFLPGNNSEQGRQMRPRPLDPQQPLPIFVEGRDQEFNECDGVSSSWVLKLQESDNPNKYHVAAAAGRKVESTRIPSCFHMKKEDIKIPSYRTVLGYCEEHGCQSGEWTYAVPQSYIRHTETTAKSQMDVAEYDMEDDDQEWLQKFNEGVAESKMASKLSEDEFEKLIEYFEKESAQVSAQNHIQWPLNDVLKISKDKNRPTLNSQLEMMSTSRSGKQVRECSWEGGNSILSRTPQMSDCCICNGGENSGSNPVYRCKSCLIYVHQSCYGVYESRNSGQACSLDSCSWYCRKCEVFGSANVDVCCAICLKYGGALKPTTDPAKWAHVVCALYTNETFFVNTDSMEPIDGISSVEVRSRRQKRLCWFCGSRLGSCERCSVYGCGVTFHVSCGVNRGAYFELQHTNQQVVRVRSFCPRHASAVAVSSIGEGSTRLKEKDIAYEKGMVQEDGYSSDLCRLSKVLQSDQEGPSAWRDMDDRQLERTGTEVGFIKEESSMKDPCRSPNNCHFSIPKRQRRQISVGRIQSADGKGICKPLSQKRMLVIDPCNNDDCHQRGDDGSLLYSTDTDVKPRGLQLSDCTINRNVNVGLVGRSISGNDGNQLIKLEEVLKANVGLASVVSEVYSYWLSKRVKKKGPLLQKFQQEQTAKRHDIFNQDFSGLRAYFGLKVDSSNIMAGYDLIDIEMVIQKLMGLQRELESLRSIAKRIMVRERVKAQLRSVLQKISEMKLVVLQKNLGLMSCFSCESSQNVLHCVHCRRIFCFECYKLWNGCGIKSYRILSSRRCICRDCGASKSEYLNDDGKNILIKSEMVNREKILIGCPSSNLACDTVTAKPHGKGRTEESQLKNEPSLACITKIVHHSMLEGMDSRTDSLLNPNMQGTHETCSMQETHETCCLAATDPPEEIDGHPLERGGKQRSACKTVLLSELTDVGLGPGSSPLKNASRPCHNSVQRNRCKGKKIKTSDSIPVSS